VGRNNKQNDRLTCKEAEKTDLWLHVKDITGSHVIVTCDGEMPPDRTIEEAAIIAACNSKGRNSSIHIMIIIPYRYGLFNNLFTPLISPIQHRFCGIFINS